MEYKCYLCKEVFIGTRSDEEAVEEMKETWGDITKEECEVVCDDCYKKIDPNDEKNKEVVEKAIQDVIDSEYEESINKLKEHATNKDEEKFIEYLLNLREEFFTKTIEKLIGG